MGKVKERFEELRRNKKKAFIPYITFGFPDIKTFEDILFALDSSGADFIEIGLPFSDPIADGPIIQASSKMALEKGANIFKLFEFLKKVKRRLNSGLILMSYYNPIFNLGLKNFFKRISPYIEAVVVPDLLVEEAKDFVEEAHTHSVDTVFFVSPTTQKERLSLIDRYSSGFVYYISVTGVTGPRESLPSQILKHLRQIRNQISRPICIGFGISNQAQARKFKKHFDGIIVGSVLIEKIFKTYKHKDFLKKFKNFLLWLNT